MFPESVASHLQNCLHQTQTAPHQRRRPPPQAFYSSHKTWLIFSVVKIFPLMVWIDALLQSWCHRLSVRVQHFLTVEFVFLRLTDHPCKQFSLGVQLLLVVVRRVWMVRWADSWHRRGWEGCGTADSGCLTWAPLASRRGNTCTFDRTLAKPKTTLRSCCTTDRLWRHCKTMCCVCQKFSICYSQQTQETVPGAVKVCLFPWKPSHNSAW